MRSLTQIQTNNIKPSFITLHWNNIPALVNVNNVVIMKNNEFKDITGHSYLIDESYDDLVLLLTQCASQIYGLEETPVSKEQPMLPGMDGNEYEQTEKK